MNGGITTKDELDRLGDDIPEPLRAFRQSLDDCAAAADDTQTHRHQQQQPPHKNIFDEIPRPSEDDLRAAQDMSAELMKEITETETLSIIEFLKTDKASDPGGVISEMIIGAAEPLARFFTPIFNDVLRSRQIPECWRRSTLFMLYKKGDPSLFTNYRPIALLSVVYKLFAIILQRRLAKHIASDGVLTACNAGFRRNRVTSQKQLLLLHAIEDANATGRPLFIGYIDIKGAFDSVTPDRLAEALRFLGLTPDAVDLLCAITRGNTCQAITGFGLTDEIKILRGVRQGCPLSPILWILFLEPLLRWWHKDDSDGYVHSISGTRIVSTAYADDMSILAKSEHELQM